ncbi:MAG: paaZ [Frondihabitans sp.]|nr:paaZ [Frondihabitans sp.]
MNENKTRVVSGWTGRYFEDFTVGDIYEHPMARTVSTTDNQWFTLITQNTSKTHLDSHYAKQTEYGRPLVNSTFTLALVTGQSTIDLSFNVYANLGWDEVRCPAPVFEGDTIYSRSLVTAVRASGSKPTVGIITVATQGFNQSGTIVISYRRTFMVYRQGEGPAAASAQPDLASLVSLARDDEPGHP